MDARCLFPQADWSTPLSGGAQARGSWMLLEGRGLAPNQETLGGGSECGHLRSPGQRSQLTPPELGARVVSPYCLREAPVVVLRSPARAPCLSGSQAAFCAPPAGDTTPQPLQALPRQPTAVLLAGSDLRSALFSPLVSLPLRDLPGTIPPSRLPPRAAGPIPIPFAFFFFLSCLVIWGFSCLLEVFLPAFSTCSVRIVPYVDVSLMCLWDLDPTSHVPTFDSISLLLKNPHYRGFLLL